jgi:hypothetical protein
MLRKIIFLILIIATAFLLGYILSPKVIYTDALESLLTKTTDSKSLNSKP